MQQTRCSILTHVQRDVRTYTPLDDFLPMPSLSTTSSAHCMCLSSAGSARKRRVPEVAWRRRTGWVVVTLPLVRFGCAVCVPMLFVFDMLEKRAVRLLGKGGLYVSGRVGGGGTIFGCRIVEWLACSALGGCGSEPGAYRDTARFGGCGVKWPGTRGPGLLRGRVNVRLCWRAVIE
jgi:hypothetical protein